MPSWLPFSRATRLPVLFTASSPLQSQPNEVSQHVQLVQDYAADGTAINPDTGAWFVALGSGALAAGASIITPVFQVPVNEIWRVLAMGVIATGSGLATFWLEISDRNASINVAFSDVQTPGGQQRRVMAAVAADRGPAVFPMTWGPGCIVRAQITAAVVGDTITWAAYRIPAPLGTTFHV